MSESDNDPDTIAATPKYEVKVVGSDDDLQALLSAHYLDGWRLVAMTEDTDDWYTCVLERPVVVVCLVCKGAGRVHCGEPDCDETDCKACGACQRITSA